MNWLGVIGILLGTGILLLIVYFLIVVAFIRWQERHYITNMHEFTYEYLEPDEENQIQPIEVYKDGEYSHTVNAHYFTEEQLDRIKGNG